MAFDFKKEHKEFYSPPKSPTIIEIPTMNYISIKGKGNPNEKNGEYQDAISLLYSIAFTIKMSHKDTYKIDGYFEYIVPPLEGFWWQEDMIEIDYTHKDKFNWISIIRLPDFVTEGDFNWALAETTKKKERDFSKIKFLTYSEGLCVQCMHIGSYNNEPITLQAMEKFSLENDYIIDITPQRFHHEIYLSDPRKCDVSKLKTVLRHPIKIKD